MQVPEIAGPIPQPDLYDPEGRRRLAPVGVALDDLGRLLPAGVPLLTRISAADASPPIRLSSIADVGIGYEVTNAAIRAPGRHGAGFSDSSHFSRTFRRMFGVAADSLRVS